MYSSQILQQATTYGLRQLLDSDELSFRFDAGVSISSTAISKQTTDKATTSF